MREFGVPEKQLHVQAVREGLQESAVREGCVETIPDNLLNGKSINHLEL